MDDINNTEDQCESDNESFAIPSRTFDINSSTPAGSFRGLRDELNHEGEDGVGDELQGEGVEELHEEHVG